MFAANWGGGVESGQSLRGRVAVVTGGASGIGRATAERFLAEGASVVVGDLNVARGEDFLAEAMGRGSGAQARFVRVDVAQEDDLHGLVGLAVSDFGGLDIMLNNAGVGGAFGPLTRIEVADWDYTFAVLTRSVFLGMKHAALAMEGSGGGSIINTASVAAFTGGASPMAYSAAKAAVVNMTQSAAVELAPVGIRVNAVCPGLIATPMTVAGGDPDAVARTFDAMQPWPHHGTVDDVASAVTFLAGDASRFVTGASLVVDGGLHARGPALLNQVAATRAAGVAGVNRGTTGQETTVRYRPPRGGK
jgi:NAD(P)-dependent dehydrogenase (short-subunit alcohol dehydrogenase family)